MIDNDIHLIKHFVTFCLRHTFSSVYFYMYKYRYKLTLYQHQPYESATKNIKFLFFFGCLSDKLL